MTEYKYPSIGELKIIAQEIADRISADTVIIKARFNGVGSVETDNHE